ncbi:MAG: uracil-DNA glycosylase family protein [Bacteroidales bacterium]|nr:uracil-DNA glycosylase family protein [Bacteroidales bacterium]
MAETEKHPFEPFLPSGTRVLFLGSFPPQKKRWCIDFFYPNYINDFWRICGLLFYDDREHFILPGAKRFDKDRIIEFCKHQGIALFDTATAVRRLQDNASDKYLEITEPTDIAALLEKIPECESIAATGQKAAEILAGHFGCELPTIGDYKAVNYRGRELRFWRMPSTSRAYPLPLEKKAEVYRRLFASLTGRREL